MPTPLRLSTEYSCEAKSSGRSCRDIISRACSCDDEQARYLVVDEDIAIQVGSKQHPAEIWRKEPRRDAIYAARREDVEYNGYSQ